jgi:neutral amino acid transport system permease protein
MGAMNEPGGSGRPGGAAVVLPPSPRRSPILGGWRRHPGAIALAVIGALVVALLIGEGAHAFGQATVDGLVSGSYFALGAVGLTFVYGILKLVNFAQGDFLAFGAYMALLANVTLGLPLEVAALFAIVATAALGIGFELVMWRPMRAKGAGTLQLILMSIGLAFLLRYGIQFVAGTSPQTLNANITSSVSFLGGLTIGRTELIVAVIGYLVLTAVGVLLRYSRLGKQMRALADSVELAETTGIDTGRVILLTWLFAGGLAGLAGVLYATSIGSFTPDFGAVLLLSLFAAVILGGIGNPYGALAGGIVLGLVQEWSTLLIDSRWKVAVGFAVLILVLIVRPTGILGRARTP